MKQPTKRAADDPLVTQLTVAVKILERAVAEVYRAIDALSDNPPQVEQKDDADG